MDLVSCPRCGEIMRRSRRSFFESLFFAAAYRCDECRLRIRFSRLKTLKTKRYVSCPRCGNFSLNILSRRDHIDSMSKNPLRRMLGMLHARLYHCRGCRYQFHDLRRRAPTQKKPASKFASPRLSQDVR